MHRNVGTRQFSWIRKVQGVPELSFLRPDEPKPEVDGMSFLGFEKVRKPALYDTGDFIVVDTVKGLEYTVLRVDRETGYPSGPLRKVPLSLAEAIMHADGYQLILNDGLID